MFKEVLVGRGHTVTFCENGAIAIDLCIEQGRQFDLIFMNGEMPLMNGVETVRELRAHEATRDVPIVGVTAGENIDGTDVHLAKPFGKRTLLSILEPFEQSLVLDELPSGSSFDDRAATSTR